MSDAVFGSIGWMDLTVDDAPRLRDFYAGVAGWTVETCDVGGYDDYTLHELQDPAGAVCALREPPVN